RFLFNVGEGTQRLCTEHGIRLAKAEHAFFTNLTSDTLGGVPGMVLTLADIKNSQVPAAGQAGRGGGAEEEAEEAEKGEVGGGGSRKQTAFTLHGPPGLSEFYHATRHFMHREDFPVEFEAVETTFKHSEMSIRQVPIMRKQSRFPPAATTAKQDHPRPSNKRPREEEEDEGENGDGPSAVVGGASPGEERRGDGGVGGGGVGCVCYICDPPALTGKFDVLKAKALKVPHGPLFGELQRGNDVTLKDGTVIKPSQVLGPAKTGAAVVIVDCPSTDLLPSLVSNPAWERLYAGPDNTPTVTDNDPAKGGGKGRKRGGYAFEGAPCLIHVAPAEVLRSPEYGEWAKRFGPEAKHLVTRQPFCSPHTIFQAAHDQVVRLNRVCGAAFPVPRQFAGGVPWESGVDGVAGDGSGDGDTRDGGDSAGEGAGIIPPEVRRIGREELDFGGKVMAAVPLLKFEMLPTAKRPQMDATEALTWDRSRDSTQASLQRLESIHSGPCSRSPSPRRSRSRSRSPSPSPGGGGGGGGGRKTGQALAPFLLPTGASKSEVAFLGTGSALPSKYRNVTGMLVRLSPTDPACPAAGVMGMSDSNEAREGLCGGGGSGSGSGSGSGDGGRGGGGGEEADGDDAAAFGGGGSILLDAGEGSMGQLWRMYGDSSSNSSGGGGGGGAAGGGRGGGGAGGGGV
ncbi:unnamed protein product, partial [Ectocarpus fasciculatus]